MERQTHLKAKRDFIGQVLEIQTDFFARVSLVTKEEMVVDEYGLIHGGFTFGLADFAAMLAVNHPNVVLASANVQFIKPVKLGDILIAIGQVIEKKDSERLVHVQILVAEKTIFEGDFRCKILPKHPFV
ncbi:transcription factor FapR [bacterium BMS3Abin05]|nr:transcription factor FapR [bacterium BMS3Abin05]GBE27485.1 transcription factor FapR [bacterium BMS3Bbin03]HDZ12865.1 thioesterase [Bacteroidota bacterium]